MRSWGDTWMHPESPMKIGWATFAGSWDRSPWSSRNRGHRSVFTESNGPRLSHDFSIKRCSLFLCILTLDWIVKKVSSFLAKSWVLRDPPAFRLDCDPIGAGLITNPREIWSNSPLEHRTYTEEETEQIHSNRRDLEPIGLVVWIDHSLCDLCNLD